jgi:hypothetical protein
MAKPFCVLGLQQFQSAQTQSNSFSKKAKTKGGTKRRLLFLLFELP